MRRNLILFFTGSFVFLAFVFFSYLVHKDIFNQLDFDTTVRLQDNISRRFDSLFSIFSIIGDFEILTTVLLVLLFFLRKIVAGVVLFSGFVAFHLIELYGKLYVHHPPPPEFMLRTERPIQFPQFHVRSEFSYPSGHSGRTIFLSAIIIYMVITSTVLPRWIKVLLVGIVIFFDGVMLFSRVYLGEHWLTDVLGGSLLALGISLIGLSFITSKKNGQTPIHHLTK